MHESGRGCTVSVHALLALDQQCSNNILLALNKWYTFNRAIPMGSINEMLGIVCFVYNLYVCKSHNYVLKQTKQLSQCLSREIDNVPLEGMAIYHMCFFFHVQIFS